MLVSFVVSYAVSNIVAYLLLALFLFDLPSNLKTKFKTLYANKIVLGFILLFLIQVFSLLYSTNTTEGLRRVEVLLPLLFLPLVIYAEPKNNNLFQKLLLYLKFTIPILFLALLFIHIFIDNRVVSTFVHFTLEEKLGVSQFYLIFILLIPLIVSSREISLKNNILLNAIILLSTLGIIVILGNKLSVLLLIALWLFLIIKKRDNLKKMLATALLGILLGILAFQIPVVHQRIQTFGNTLDFDLNTIITKNRFTVTKNTLEHRLLINYLASKEIAAALPFGVGIGDRQDVLNKQYEIINFKAGMLNQYNNHNQYLSEFLKSGILGGLVFLVLMALLIKSAFTSNQLGLITVLFFAIACGLESYLFRQHGVIIFTFVIPLFLNHKNTNYEKY
ncbi:O-antigen ligase family protein [Winogradskyella pelagia]|nr:O-antigen ligase family protein [Winogradskyella sp. DF17]